MDARSSDGTLDRNVEILLKVYETEHSQCLTRVGFLFSMYQIFSVIAAAIFSYVLSTRLWDAILVLPPISVGLFLRAIWDQHLARISAEYLRDEIEPILTKYVNEALSSSMEKPWTGWLSYYPSRYGLLPKYHEHSIFIVFGIIPFAPSIIYCIYCAASVHYKKLPIISVASHLHLNSGLFGVASVLSAVVLTFGLVVMFRTIYAENFE